MKVEWSDWPARRRPAVSIFAAVVIAVAVGAAASWDPWIAVVGAAALVLATSEVLLPTRYRLDPDGVHLQRPFQHRHIPWDRVRGFVRTDVGFVVQGRGSRPLLARRYTATLRCPGREDAVARVLAMHVDGEE